MDIKYFYIIGIALIISVPVMTIVAFPIEIRKDFSDIYSNINNWNNETDKENIEILNVSFNESLGELE